MTIIVDGTNGITTPTTLNDTSTFGYTTGAGGTVTQATSKTTTVTLNKPTGQILTAADALAANTGTSFTFNNSFMSSTDVLLVNNDRINSYRVASSVPGAGTVTIRIENITAGSLSQAVAISFAVIKGATS